MPRNSGASAAEKGETIAGAKDAQTRTKSPSNASHAASVIASVLKKPPPTLVAACGLKLLARPPTGIETCGRKHHIATKP